MNLLLIVDPVYLKAKMVVLRESIILLLNRKVNMNLFRKLILSIFLLSAGAASASYDMNRQFNQDYMITTPYNVIVVSSFNDADFLTAFNEYGSLAWKVKIPRNVLSMKLKDGYLYVFSQHHYKESTTLSCIDPINGSILWERP